MAEVITKAARSQPKMPTPLDFHEPIMRVAESLASWAATTKIPLPWMPGKGLVGRDYVAQLAIPNFFFHTTTAYSILRHTGVELGKADYVGNLDFIDV